MSEATASGRLDVLCCQLDIVWEDKPANFERVERMIASARPGAGTLIVLPEMFATGFSMNAAALAEPPGGLTEEFLARLARQFQCMIAAGLPARPPGVERATNDAVVLNAHGQLAARYSKVHLFTPADEPVHYQPGREIRLFDAGPLRASSFVCYDLRFPELARKAVREGAELLVYIANWPQVRQAHWLALLKARAIENQAFVIGVNRCGQSPKDAYGGRSIVFDAHGEALAQAGEGEEPLSAQLDAQALREYRTSFPALRDARLL